MVRNDQDSLNHKKYSYVEVNYEILNFENKKENIKLTRKNFIYDTICDVNYRVLKTIPVHSKSFNKIYLC